MILSPDDDDNDDLNADDMMYDDADDDIVVATACVGMPISCADNDDDDDDDNHLRNDHDDDDDDDNDDAVLTVTNMSLMAICVILARSVRICSWTLVVMSVLDTPVMLKPMMTCIHAHMHTCKSILEACTYTYRRLRAR